jgi:hypothetical protein
MRKDITERTRIISVNLAFIILKGESLPKDSDYYEYNEK